MNTSNKTHTVTEFGFFTRGVRGERGRALPERTFDLLEEFVLANAESTESGTAPLVLSTRRGLGKIITARNQVGLVALSNGDVIEILPKIANVEDVGECRKVLLTMLREPNDLPFAVSTLTGLDTAKMNLLEILIRMFLDEVAQVLQRGLRAQYQNVEQNEVFYKGSLVPAAHLRENLLTKHRFYVSHDEFNVDRAENRILKSAVARVLRLSRSSVNRREASRLQSSLSVVPSEANLRKDFALCSTDRTISYYQRALSWAKIFLLGKAFTTYVGPSDAVALLFPMEMVFEAFIAGRVRKAAGAGQHVGVQDQRYWLFDSPRAFSLRPDIVVFSEGETLVIDTKWKLLDTRRPNLGISGEDMYQLAVYAKKYHASKVILAYPQPLSGSIPDRTFSSDDGLHVEVAFVDLKRHEKIADRLLSSAR